MKHMNSYVDISAVIKVLAAELVVNDYLGTFSRTFGSRRDWLWEQYDAAHNSNQNESSPLFHLNQYQDHGKRDVQKLFSVNGQKLNSLILSYMLISAWVDNHTVMQVHKY